MTKRPQQCLYSQVAKTSTNHINHYCCPEQSSLTVTEARELKETAALPIDCRYEVKYVDKKKAFKTLLEAEMLVS